eukprot:1159613-Pelagomonas_calceolata.AAC.12
MLHFAIELARPGSQATSAGGEVPTSASLHCRQKSMDFRIQAPCACAHACARTHAHTHTYTHTRSAGVQMSELFMFTA